MASPTLLDLAKANGSDPLVGLVEEVLPASPEFQVGYSRPIKGLEFKTLVRTALPTVAFRHANEGVTAQKSTYENRRFECHLFNPRIECDKAVAAAYEDGPEAWMALEGAGVLKSSLIHLAKQMYYGNEGTGLNDAKGHPGLLQSYDATNMVVDAGGTTDDVASSVWLIAFGATACGWVFGNQGELKLSDVAEALLPDANGAYFTKLWQEILAQVGFQVAAKHAAVRIKKITTDNGKGLTDDLIYEALAKFPVGVRPTAGFATRRSLEQLRKSRTATNATGAPAPPVTEVDGIPIFATDSISNTEKLAS